MCCVGFSAAGPGEAEDVNGVDGMSEIKRNWTVYKPKSLWRGETEYAATRIEPDVWRIFITGMLAIAMFAGPGPTAYMAGIILFLWLFPAMFKQVYEKVEEEKTDE